MSFQVRVRINTNRVDVLSVASSFEEFEKFTIGELKKKALILFPGVNDPTRLKVIFGLTELKDNQTFEVCNIEHLSVLVIMLLTPGGGGSPKSTGNESSRKVTENVGLLDRLRLGSSFGQSGAEKGKIQERDSASQYKGAIKLHSDADPVSSDRLRLISSFAQSGAEKGKIQECDSVSQYKGATKPHSDADPYDYSKKWSNPSDSSVKETREKKQEEKMDQLPAEASSVQPDADLQFLQSLLPALRRMDLRRREQTKLSIQQLVFESEFNTRFEPHGGMRRTNSKEHLPNEV